MILLKDRPISGFIPLCLPLIFHEAVSEFVRFHVHVRLTVYESNSDACELRPHGSARLSASHRSQALSVHMQRMCSISP